MKKRPVAELLTIGDEILKGCILNSNAQYLGTSLTKIGFLCSYQSVCADVENEIKDALDRALTRSDIVIMTGGLGPTPDDVTREAVSSYFNVPLKFSATQYNRILKYFRAVKKHVPAECKKEAQFPANAKPLNNACGIALGFSIQVGKKWIFVLPGVPREMKKMYEDSIVPILSREFKEAKPKFSLTIQTVGLGESVIMTKLGKDFFKLPFDFGIYPHPGHVTIRLQMEKKSVHDALKKYVTSKIGGDVYAWEEMSLAEAVGRALRKKKKKLAVAESCTAGLLAATIATVPGASDYFLGGVISYSNDVKIKEPNVKETTLAREGAVALPVAKEMALGALAKFDSDLAVSITGIAGPTGGTVKKPIGTVCIAIATAKQTFAEKFIFVGSRSHIQERTVTKALEMIWRLLENESVTSKK